MATENEIKSLISLLDDPDPFVRESVESRFLELGEKAVPLLDEFQGLSSDVARKLQIEEILHLITFQSLQEDFVEVLHKGIKNRVDLEHAVFTLCRFGTPTLRIADYKRRLDLWAETLEPMIRFKLDEAKKMKQVLRFVFHDLGFKGDLKTYHHTDNAYLDKVINRKQGLPISLSLIVMFIGQRLGLPFFGVNMPIHFMLNFVGDREDLLIDPYDSGAVVTYDQCYFFLKKNGIDPTPQHFQIASDFEIFIRCIRNLMQSYERMEQPHRVEHLKTLLEIAELSSPHKSE